MRPPGFTAEIDDQLPHGLKAIGRILLQGLLDQESQTNGKIRRQRRGLVVCDRVERIEVGLARERAAPRQQLIQHEAERTVPTT